VVTTGTFWNFPTIEPPAKSGEFDDARLISRDAMEQFIHRSHPENGRILAPGSGFSILLRRRARVHGCSASSAAT